jgi:hypothetical protein
MAKRRRRELVASDRFHAAVVSLLRVRHSDWTEWEETWLLDNAQRPQDYIYSDDQRRILNQLIACSKSYGSYAGYTVAELLEIAWRDRYDVDEEAQEFIETIRRRNANELKLRQIRRLAGIARIFECVGRDQALDVAGRSPGRDNVF